jgi:hypothetical protein
LSIEEFRLLLEGVDPAVGIAVGDVRCNLEDFADIESAAPAPTECGQKE